MVEGAFMKGICNMMQVYMDVSCCSCRFVGLMMVFWLLGLLIFVCD